MLRNSLIVFLLLFLCPILVALASHRLGDPDRQVLVGGTQRQRGDCS